MPGISWLTFATTLVCGTLGNDYRNRSRTIIAYADPVEGLASQLFARVRPKVEALALPTLHQTGPQSKIIAALLVQHEVETFVLLVAGHA